MVAIGSTAFAILPFISVAFGTPPIFPYPSKDPDDSLPHSPSLADLQRRATPNESLRATLFVHLCQAHSGFKVWCCSGFDETSRVLSWPGIPLPASSGHGCFAVDDPEHAYVPN